MSKARKPDLSDKFEATWNLVAPKNIAFVREHRFHATRKWRFDLAFVKQRVAVELEGGIFHGRTGHSSVTGMKRDMEKYNAATLGGWRVLRYHAQDLRDRPVQVVEEVLFAIHNTPTPAE